MRLRASDGRREALIRGVGGPRQGQPGHGSEVRCEEGDSFQNKSGVAKNTLASYWLWRRQRSSMLDTVGSPPIANGLTWWNSTSGRSPQRRPFGPVKAQEPRSRIQTVRFTA